jgi:hypothetical protein
MYTRRKPISAAVPIGQVESGNPDFAQDWFRMVRADCLKQTDA